MRQQLLCVRRHTAARSSCVRDRVFFLTLSTALRQPFSFLPAQIFMTFEDQ